MILRYSIQFSNFQSKDPLLHNIFANELKDGMNNNQVTIGFLKAIIKSMKISSGNQAIQVYQINYPLPIIIKLLRKSFRISEDLNKILPYGKDLFSAKIVIREWLDSVPENPGMVFELRMSRANNRNFVVLLIKMN
jgi:hypothetical protein